MNDQSNVITVLPSLVFNQSFLKSFVEEHPPCASLGLVEIEGEEKGFIAIKADQPIKGANGFELGSQLLGYNTFTTLHLILNFDQDTFFDVLVNLNTPVAKKVIAVWEATGEYFFFAFNNGGLTAFNNKIGQAWYDDSYFSMAENAINTVEQFKSAEELFRQGNNPYGTYLDLLFQNNTEFLDVSENRFEIKSRGQRK